MNIKIVVLSALFVVLLFGGIQTDAAKAKREPKPLNVVEPIAILKTAYSKFINKIDIVKLLVLFIDIFYDCLLPTLIPQATSSLLNAENFNRQVNESQLQFLADKLSQLDTIPGLPLAKFNCSTDVFLQIHNFIWVQDHQLEDLVHFFGKFGYSNIYDHIKGNYTESNCAQDLIDQLPKDPKDPPEGSIKRSKGGINGQSKLANVREQILQSRNVVNQEGPTCNILEIILKMPETGLIQLLNLIETVMFQFNTNPNLHFLIGKLQEPIKGVSVNEFRCQGVVLAILEQMHQKLIDSPVWSEIFKVIKDLIEVDFTIVNPYDFIISLFQYLVWQTPFPPAGPCPDIP